MPASDAITLENTISYGSQSGPLVTPTYGDPNVVVGAHEEAHVLQYMELDPACLPSYLASGPIVNLRNPFEAQAQRWGSSSRSGGYWP